MIKNMWNINLSYAASGITVPPDEIIEAQCKYLLELTGGKIIARVSAYKIYEENDVPNDKFVFEFYLSSLSAPYYKFRVMFISYPIEYYPVAIELDDEIAEELGTTEGSNRDSRFRYCDKEEEFISILPNIINSKKVNKVINSLYVIANSHERRDGEISS